MARKLYDTPYPASERQPMHGQMVAVMNLKMDRWNNSLIEPRSQAIRKTDIHELVVTAETDAGPGGVVQAAAFLGFFEVTVGGLLVSGDQVRIGDRQVGRVAGFNSNHMPNHLNIVVQVPDLRHGEELGLHIGYPVSFLPERVA